MHGHYYSKPLKACLLGFYTETECRFTDLRQTFLHFGINDPLNK